MWVPYRPIVRLVGTGTVPGLDEMKKKRINSHKNRADEKKWYRIGMVTYLPYRTILSRAKMLEYASPVSRLYLPRYLPTFSVLGDTVGTVPVGYGTATVGYLPYIFKIIVQYRTYRWVRYLA